MSASVRDFPAVDWGWKNFLPVEMDWAKPEFSRNQVNKAGVIIASVPPEWGQDDWYEKWLEYRRAIQVVNNWRSAHSYPLNIFQTNLRARAGKIVQKPLVSQRLKRFQSIVKKLQRAQTETLELSQMQDIGGCRAVLQHPSQVRRLAKSYLDQKTKKFTHKLIGTGKDYLTNPKLDGYRSIHLIFRYVGPPSNNAWDKLRIEMQLRTVPQHAWATALEAVDIFTNQALKANQGDVRWQRFFAIMASVIALKENCPRVSGTPENDSELRSELKHLADELNAVDVLHGFRTAIQATQGEKSNNKAAYYVLHLSFNKRRVSWTSYGWNQSQEANARYTELEQELADKAGEHIVLVKAGSLSAMKRAYPGFFLDTGLFVDLVWEALGNSSGSIIPPDPG